MKFADIERAIAKLNARKRETGDRRFRVMCSECGDYLGWTKVSRGGKSSDQVGASIAGEIHKQLGMPRVLLLDIIECTKGLLEYQAAHGHAH